MNSLLASLLAMIAPVVVGSLTTVVMQLLKNISSMINGLPSYGKQLVVTLIAFGLTTAAGVLGIHLSTTNVSALSSTDVQSLLSSIVAILIHTGIKGSTGTPTVAPAAAATATDTATSSTPPTPAK